MTSAPRARYIVRNAGGGYSELGHLNLARSRRQVISSDFAQVITITFAMVVAIYYFLHQAGIWKVLPSLSTPWECSLISRNVEGISLGISLGSPTLPGARA